MMKVSRKWAIKFSMIIAVFAMAQTVGAITFQEFPLQANSMPFRISLGPDGNLWFTEFNGNNIGRITRDGIITEYAIPTFNSQPIAIIPGPDGNLWFTESNGNKIGQISPLGVILNEFQVPTPSSKPTGITMGPDGNLWFTEQNTNKVGFITTSGAITEFDVPASSQPTSIRTGPDGNLWFTETSGNRIATMSTQGVLLKEFLVPTGNSQPDSISLGPDGNLWFCEQNGNKIGRITTAGEIMEFPLPLAGSNARAIRTGPDGNLWFTVFGTNGNRIGKITTGGAINEYVIPTTSSGPGNIAIGPDGNLWFTEENGNKIGQAVITAGEMPVPSANQFIDITPPAVFPILNPIEIQAVPISIGALADGGSIFAVSIGFGLFSAPVDIYAAFTLSSVPEVIYLLNPDGKTFQTFTLNQINQALLTGVPPAGFVPWVSNTLGELYVPLIEDLPVSQLAPGTYTLYVAAFPAGSFGAYNIWQTGFIVP